MSIWDVLNPGITTKKWEVDIYDDTGGHSKGFWFKKNALKYIKDNWNSYKGIYLTNEITEKKTVINDPDEKKKDPTCQHKWLRTSSAVWRCIKCGAKFKLSCIHSSIACWDCIEDFIKDIERGEKFEDFLSRKSW